MVSSRAVLLALGLPALVRGTPYTLTKEYFGSSFFEGWNFFGNGGSRCATCLTLLLNCPMSQLTISPTATRSTCAKCPIRPCSDYRVLLFPSLYYFTHCSFVTAAQAAALQLAYINSAGNAIIKVDNTTVVPPNSDRNTVRITTEEAFPVGNLWIVDMLHVPFGVGQHFLDLLMRANAPSPIAKSKVSEWRTDSFPSAPFGLHSGPMLLHRIGPQAERLTRLKLSTMYSMRRWHCTLSLGAPSSMPYRRARSSTQPTAMSKRMRTWAASLRIRTGIPMAPHLRLPVVACLPQS
jgi:hypothetical protein